MIGRIVVLCRYLPDPTKSSGELRFSHILRLLQRRAERIEVFAETHGNAHLWRDLPIHPADALEERCGDADLAFLEFWFMERYLPVLRARGIPVVLDSVDLEFVRREREARVLGLPAATYAAEKELELAAYRQADQVWAVSRPDAEQVRELEDKLIVVPNVFEPVGEIPGFDDRGGVVFVGSYHHQPNVDGLRWYRDHVLPRVPEAPHVFVGHGAPADLAALPGFVGGVPDSAEVVRRARVSIAPLRYGAGLKGKILEALACGTPVVTTPIGDEGYNAGAEGAAIVTESAEEFADAVARIARERDLWREMSSLGLRIAARYTPEQVGRTIDEALARLSGRAGTGP